MLQVVSTPSGRAALSIDGELRTEANAGAFAFDGMIICAVEERSHTHTLTPTLALTLILT